MKWRSRPEKRLSESGGGPSSRDWIAAFYTGLLGRASSADEVDGWLRVLTDRGPESVIVEMLNSDECRQSGWRSRGIGEKWSRSQYGEVEILLSRLARTLSSNPYIVEVGAAGVEISNSIDLIGTMGWSGLLIEASPPHAEELRRAVSDIPAIVVPCAIASTEGTATFYVGMHPHLSSLDRKTAESWGPILGEISVATRRLPAVLDEFNVPKEFLVLSIDIEGLDFVVLNDLISTSDYRPRWIIIEWGSTIFSASMNDERISEAVRSEYEIVAKTFSNVFLERRSGQ